MMHVTRTSLPGVVVIEPEIYKDERGFFLETYQKQRCLREAGISLEFVQDNYSRSKKDVLRGLHFQKMKPQGKLVRVTEGEVLDIAVDIDPLSDTFGRYEAVILSSDNFKQLWIPPGYAHGFIVLSEFADFAYKCTDYFDSDDEGGIRWDDPFLSIDWPTLSPVVSDKDRNLPTVEEWIKASEEK